MQSDSGLSFKSTFIRFSIEGASLACKFNLEQSLSYSTTVYSGCKPFQKLVPYFELNRTNLYCPKISSLDDSIPCTNYNNDFYPKFQILDVLTNATTTFTGNYSMAVLGYGDVSEKLIYLSAADINRINPNKYISNQNLIWVANPKVGWNQGSPVFNVHTSALRWVCSTGSPCENRIPTSSSSSPYIYLLFNAKTTGLDSVNSYCAFESNFVVKLYGIPQSFQSSGLTILGGFLFGILVAFTIIFIDSCKKTIKDEKG